MNEAEKHYSGQGGGTGRDKGQGGSGSTLDQVSSTAREGLKTASDAVRSATDTARQTASGAYGRASQAMGDARRRSTAEFSRRSRGVEAFVEENPVMVGVVGLATGLLLGALLPGTRRENQVFGRYADEVRDQGLRYARELAEQGKSMVEENLESVTKGTDGGDESRAA